MRLSFSFRSVCFQIVYFLSTHQGTHGLELDQAMLKRPRKIPRRRSQSIDQLFVHAVEGAWGSEAGTEGV
jgi:hypothetical protein